MNFLEELEKLRLLVPRLANINVGSENSDYCTHSDKNKNCYMLFAANFNEDCYYGGIVLESRDCVDCEVSNKCELCFECVDVNACYNCNYSQELATCTDCHFCYDCIGCENCFGSAGLRQKKYVWFNEPLNKKEYQKRLAKFDWQDAKQRAEAVKKMEAVKQKTPRVYSKQLKTINCVGDHIVSSKNCYYAFDAYESEDSMYLYEDWRTKDCLDMHFSDGSELCYECFSIGLGSYNCNFSDYIRTCSDMEYCDLCFSSKNCFGCVGLKNREYYILNKPQKPAEYRKKVAEIKAEMRAQAGPGRQGIYGQHLPTTYRWEDTAAANL